MNVERTGQIPRAQPASNPLDDVEKRERLRSAANNFLKGQINLEEYLAVQEEFGGIYPPRTQVGFDDKKANPLNRLKEALGGIFGKEMRG